MICIAKGQLKLGGSSEFTLINAGGKAQGSINIGNRDISDIHSYSLDTKGLSIGLNIEGAVIGIRGDCNNTFYGKKTTVEQIADGTAIIPQEHIQNADYIKIVQMLDQYFSIHAVKRPAPKPKPKPQITPIAFNTPYHFKQNHRIVIRGPHGGHIRVAPHNMKLLDCKGKHGEFAQWDVTVLQGGLVKCNCN